jgi:hypothetical protein
MPTLHCKQPPYEGIERVSKENSQSIDGDEVLRQKRLDRDLPIKARVRSWGSPGSRTMIEGLWRTHEIHLEKSKKPNVWRPVHCPNHQVPWIPQEEICMNATTTQSAATPSPANIQMV